MIMLPFEKEILILFFKNYLNDFKEIEHIISSCNIVERKFDKVGFFTTISSKALKRRRFQIKSVDNIVGKIDKKIDVGFHVFLCKGNLEIEGFTFGGEEYPKIFSSYEIFKILDG